VRHDVVDHRRRRESPCRRARHTQRVAGEVRRPSPAPAGAIAPARRTRSPPVQLCLSRRRAPHRGRAMHGRLRGQRRLRQAKARHGAPGGLIRS
jgi:hypothetical protein